ncbi:MAG: class I SAM-dependent methyltransferase [Candidatus Hydrogenedentes bacterium]|nr:class I SAM-dependent methyltransferase [Candidatus Hydrogenedentota bacterium]
MAGSLVRATRGAGLLEGFLARKRREKALDLLRPSGAITGVLDIGCGAFPLLLMNIEAAERIGIDQSVEPDVARASAARGIEIVAHDLARNPSLPYESGRFEVVTMLAVIEHVPRDAGLTVAREVHRVLKHGGKFILTTPAAWTDPILRSMARLGLVSAQEIDEHKALFTRATLGTLLRDAGFDRSRITVGAFELGMNLWALAIR